MTCYHFHCGAERAKTRRHPEGDLSIFDTLGIGKESILIRKKERKKKQKRKSGERTRLPGAEQPPSGG